MNTSNLKLALIIIAAAGAAVALLFQHQSAAQLRENNRLLREQVAQQVGQLNALEQENQALSNQVVRPKESNLELLKLRGEVGRLRAQAGELNQLREENRRLLAQQASPPVQPGALNQASPTPTLDPRALGGPVPLGATKDELLQRLGKLHAKILTNTDALVVAEFPSRKMIDVDGITGVRTTNVESGWMEFPFRDGKYDRTDPPNPEQRFPMFHSLPPPQ